MSTPINQRRRFALKSLKRKDTIGVILLGDEKVGKTALVQRWLNDTFSDNYNPTVEDFHNKETSFMGRRIHVGIIDIAGSGQFPAMEELYISKSDSIIFVYEVGNEKSISAIESYYKKTKKVLGERGNIVTLTVAGTKLDKFDETGYYEDYEIGKEYFSGLSNSPKQFMTSAKNNTCVTELFEHSLGTVVNQLLPDEERLKVLSKANENGEKKACCAIL